jgi:hypothetical protein
LDRLHWSFDDALSGGQVDPKLLDDAANDIEWLRSIVVAILNGPFSGTSTERRARYADPSWQQVHDAVDMWERSRD